jgi:hypothetical protein
MAFIINVSALIITILWLYTISFDDQIMSRNFKIVCEDTSMCICYV